MLVQHYFWVNILFYTLQVEECRTINECKGFEFLLWYLCGYHKSEDLCCMSYAFLLVFVGLCILFISLLVTLYMLLGVGGLLRCVPFGYDLGVNTCSLVELLVVCAYYSMWNSMWRLCASHACHYCCYESGSCGLCG